MSTAVMQLMQYEIGDYMLKKSQQATEQHHQQLVRARSVAAYSATAELTQALRGAANMLVHRRLERAVSEPAPQQQQQQQPPPNASRYKTELCRPFEEAGSCKYGDKCQFAHGMRELRNLARHPKYKTELCRTYHSVGFCPYGPRCHFVHNHDEVRSARPSLPPSPGGNSPVLSHSPADSVSSFFTSSTPSSSPPPPQSPQDEQRLPIFNRLSALTIG